MTMTPRQILSLLVLAASLVAGPATADDVVEYYVLDALGNVRLITDEDGDVVERHDYYPFGEECTTGPCASNPGVDAGNPRKFTGKERDVETGLDYFGARYYGSKIGRFTTVDPVYNWNANLLDPQRWNRYAYGLNNPLRNVDPDGRDTIDLAIGFGQGIGGTAVGIVTGPIALITQPVATLSGVGQDISLLGYGVANPGIVWDQYVQLATSNNDADQRALGSAIGQGAFVAAATLAPFAKGAAGPYNHIPDGPNVGPGKAYTQSQKAEIYAANRRRSGGVLRSDCSGCELVPSQKSTKGVSTPTNAAQVDHHVPRSKGGPNSFGNARVLSAEENRIKGAN